MKIVVLLALSLGLLLLLIFGSLAPSLRCLLVFLDILSWLTFLAFLITPLSIEPTRSSRTEALSHPALVRGDGLPRIPKTVPEILRTLNYTQFELFSAAVILGLGQGYTFVERCGGSGDQGIDVKLLNVNGLRVMVQCKEYADTPVGSAEVRQFSGSLIHWRAAYGFFVTTSTFTKDAQEVIDANPAWIRAIDKNKLETQLQWRSREIAQAWREVQEKDKNT